MMSRMSDWRHEMPLTAHEVARIHDARRILGPRKVNGSASGPRKSTSTATTVGHVRFVVMTRERRLAA
jgi:hypothetical protein